MSEAEETQDTSPSFFCLFLFRRRWLTFNARADEVKTARTNKSIAQRREEKKKTTSGAKQTCALWRRRQELFISSSSWKRRFSSTKKGCSPGISTSLRSPRLQLLRMPTKIIRCNQDQLRRDAECHSEARRCRQMVRRLNDALTLPGRSAQSVRSTKLF